MHLESSAQNQNAAPRSDTTTSLSGTDLTQAAFAGNLTQVRRAVEKAGVDVNYVDPKGRTPLMMAAYRGRPKVVRYLLKQEANVNPHGEQGSPPLVAAVGGAAELEIIRMLLDHGADPTLTSPEGKTALDMANAVKPRNPEHFNEIIKLLKRRMDRRK